jgi:hypothetical protein
MEDGAKAGADPTSTFDRAAQYGCGNCPPAEPQNIQSQPYDSVGDMDP